MSTLWLVFVILIVPSSCSLPWMQEEDELNITRKFKATWNVHESFEQHNDGSVTYNSVTWGGLVGLMKERNLPVDWSGYESITVEFTEPTLVETQLLVAGTLTFGRKGITKLICYFDGVDMRQVNEVVLQTAKPATLTVKSVTLSPISTSWVSKPLWEGNCVFGNWEGGFVVKPERFSMAKEGDKLEFVYKADVSDPNRVYWQIKSIYSGTDQTLEGNFNEQNDWGCAQVGSAATVYRIRLTAKDVKELKEKGLFSNGYYVTVTQVNLLRKGVAGDSGGAQESGDEEDGKKVKYNQWQ